MYIFLEYFLKNIFSQYFNFLYHYIFIISLIIFKSKLCSLSSSCRPYLLHPLGSLFLFLFVSCCIILRKASLTPFTLSFLSSRFQTHNLKEYIFTHFRFLSLLDYGSLLCEKERKVICYCILKTSKEVKRDRNDKKRAKVVDIVIEVINNFILKTNKKYFIGIKRKNILKTKNLDIFRKLSRNFYLNAINRIKKKRVSTKKGRDNETG